MELLTANAEDVLPGGKWFQEIKQPEPNKEIIELWKAYTEGRVVILPCKVGDTVHVINRHLNRVFECTVISVGLGHNSDLKNYIKTKWIGPRGNESIRKWSLRQVGRYVFLTREEAENALKGGAK